MVQISIVSSMSVAYAASFIYFVLFIISVISFTITAIIDYFRDPAKQLNLFNKYGSYLLQVAAGIPVLFIAAIVVVTAYNNAPSMFKVRLLLN